MRKKKKKKKKKKKTPTWLYTEERKLNGLEIYKGYTYVHLVVISWATTRQHVFSGVSDQARHKPACAVTEAS